MKSNEAVEGAWEDPPKHGRDVLEVIDLPPHPKDSIGQKPD